MGGRGSTSGAGARGSSKTLGENAPDITAKAIPTDTAAVNNVSISESKIGEGVLVTGITKKPYEGYVSDRESYDNFVRYQEANIKIYGKPIEGKSEKQTNYAENVRARVVERVMRDTYKNMETQRQNMGDRKWEEGLKSAGFKSYSEFLAHSISRDKRIGELLNETSARNILDKFA